MRCRLLAGLLLWMSVLSSKLAPELKKTPAGAQSVSVIVQFKFAPPGGKMNVFRVPNAKASKQLKVINAVEAVVPVSSLAALAADSNVAYVSPDRKCMAT